MLGIVSVGVVLGGVLATSWGITTALSARRARSIGGALVAAVGLATVMLGAVAVAVPGFL